MGCAWLRFFCRQRAGGGARATLIFLARSTAVGGISPRMSIGGLNVVFVIARVKDLALAENVEEVSGNAFEGGAQQNESDIAVFGVSAGSVEREAVKAARSRSSRARPVVTLRRRAGRKSGPAACER